MKMKKLLFLVLFPLAIYSLSSCSKATDPTITAAIQQAADDDAAIKAYLLVHPEITGVKDTLGCYYQVVSTGAGAYPTATTTIKGTYTGSLLNGTAFATNASVSAPLSSLIYGWQIVLPHVPIGSKIIMLIPSIYGYGTSGSGAIPANAVLRFDVDLSPPGA
ncbi:peptidylprolyl isomerase/FKBP-type peptidyl-prolyl cis-trans isomerase FkpA [Mucilaginibacter sp. OK283]|jgi:FKBP-type peptidyl-prolyl cis-trans isomerase|nr:peptidylprolyl isomerase/FKBP-type peptidyl-prolyl cis-trans isomerase FkpA [Mucilaginibacter sp. OK283]